MKLQDICEQITVFRGITQKNLPRRYPGTYYTENPELARKYAKEGGSVHTRVIDPKNPLIIDRVSEDPVFRQYIENAFLKFMKQNNPDVDISDTQLYDNLYSGVTDFSYPTVYDNAFLRTLGFDSVKFSYEGGERVDSWYIPD